MDPRSRSEPLTARLLYRALMVWMVMMLLESINGIALEIFVAPQIGAFRARQLGMPVACCIIFAVAWCTARWLHATARTQRFVVGGLWVALSLGFEFSLGRALGTPWTRLLSDYDPARGGLMLFGLAFMLITPTLVAGRATGEALK